MVLASFITKSAIFWAMLLWLFYLIGQALHIWLRASLAVASNLNAVGTLKKYLGLKGPVITVRLFLETMLFIIFEYGSTQWFTLPTGGSPIIQAALAGFFGYGADSLLDQAFAKMGLDKELPPRAD